MIGETVGVEAAVDSAELFRAPHNAVEVFFLIPKKSGKNIGPGELETGKIFIPCPLDSLYADF